MTDAGTRPLGDLDRRLDHRQREALDAEAVDAEVALLGVEQAARDVARLGVLGEQRREALLRQPVEALVVPERVVGIETDRRDRRVGRHVC